MGKRICARLMNQKEVIKKKKLREFGFILGLGFPLLIGWILPFISGHNFKSWTLFIGIPSLLLAIIYPEILRNPFKIWMKIGLILGWFNSKIVFGLVFILILIPISSIMKIFKYDPLRKRISKKTTTYRELISNHKVNFTKIF